MGPRLVVRRVLLFFCLFSLLPLGGSLVSALFVRQGSGIRDASAGSLGLLAWWADPSFVANQVAKVTLGALVVTVILGLGSLLAWGAKEGYSVLRTSRFVTLVWLVAIVLYPAMSGWIPLLRQVPWTLVVCLFLGALGIAYSWRGARASLREWIFSAVALVAIFHSPRWPTEHLDRLAQRAFTSKDVILLGFDSVNVDETLALLKEYEPKHGQKTIFTKALTPFPSTGVAWRSMLSGSYPPAEAAIPNLRWGSANQNGWLPLELQRIGYQPTIAQDIPESNWFSAEEGLRVVGLQGWKAQGQALLWKAGFPLSAVGADWWVRLLGGPGTLYSRPAHCAGCFVADSLDDMARTAAKRPVFWIIHTCLIHGPNQLSLAEAVRVPGWWRLPGTFFLGQGKISQDPRSRATRLTTLKDTLRRTLNRLDADGVLGRATVFVLADHGPRGESVQPSTTNGVMLAMFSPMDRGNAVVTTPVSLIDIAPTIRKAVGLEAVTTDGQVLPRGDADGDSQRVVRTMTVHPVTVLDAMGFGNRSLSPEELARLGELRSDGTFSYKPETIQAFMRNLR